MILRIGADRSQEQLVLASLLVQIDRLPRPAMRRLLVGAVREAYAAGGPPRRTEILRRLVVGARHAEAAARRQSIRSGLAGLAPVARAR